MSGNTPTLAQGSHHAMCDTASRYFSRKPDRFVECRQIGDNPHRFRVNMEWDCPNQITLRMEININLSCSLDNDIRNIYLHGPMRGKGKGYIDDKFYFLFRNYDSPEIMNKFHVNDLRQAIYTARRYIESDLIKKQSNDSWFALNFK